MIARRQHVERDHNNEKELSRHGSWINLSALNIRYGIQYSIIFLREPKNVRDGKSRQSNFYGKHCQF